MKKPIATGISNSPHLVAIYDAAKTEVDNLPIENISVYIVDTALSAVLPDLADQFDVEGIKGLAFASTDTDKRELIKKAIELHRHKGTPWAIKESLKSVGYGGADIIEGDAIFLDGFIELDGSVLLGDGHWATFSVVLDLGELKGITAESTSLARMLIEEYKNARSKLIGLSFQSTLTENIIIGESFTMTLAENILDHYSGGVDLDGVAFLNGVYNLDRGRDELNLVIFENNNEIANETF
jgi:phage tail P2-like protein